MARALSASEFTTLARRGAAARLADLEREIAALRRAFPGLKPAAGGETSAGTSATLPTKLVTKVSRRGRKRPMSAAERRAVSERMKKYWADRRKSKG